MRKYLFVFLFIATQILFAGRPLKTNDAIMVGRNLLQLEFGTDFLPGRDSPDVSFPVVFTYGLSDYSDFVAGIIFNPHYSGGLLREAELGFKQTFYDNDDLKFAVASGLVSYYKDQTFSSPSAYFQLINYLKLGNTSFHFNAGYNQNFEQDQYRDLWYISGAVEIPATEKLNLAADLGIGKNPMIQNSGHDIYALIGFTYEFSPSFVADSGLNLNLAEKAKADLFTAGVTITF